MPIDSKLPTVPASQLVTTTPIADDVGADTADRFEWQAAMATADGFALVLRALNDESLGLSVTDRKIICELHEDWIVTDGTAAELVSAKHRDPARGAYTTITKLADDGGLRHLFCRWALLKEQVDCRLVTTGGMGPGEAQDFEKAALALSSDRMNNKSANTTNEFNGTAALFAQVLLRKPEHLPDIWKNLGSDAVLDETHLLQVCRFLSRLQIQHSDIQRAHLSYAAPSMYVEPVLNKLKIGHEHAPEVWESVLRLFRQRMRAAGPLETGGLPSVLPNGVSLPVAGDAHQRMLQRRTITVEDIKTAMKVGLDNPGAYEPLKRTTRTSRAAFKMEVGKCYDNSIERAEQLRMDFQTYWSERKNGDPLCGPAEQSLRRLLLRVSDETTDQVFQEDASWGRQFWKAVQANIREIPSSDMPAGMDSELLLGGVSDLANRCQVWFSERFDIDATLIDSSEEDIDS